MEPTNKTAGAYESREDLVRLVEAAGHAMPSEHQLERWRGEGLLAPVRQIQNQYRGSTVEFPIGTAKQIIEIQNLLKIKKSLNFVGWELWWSGFPVDEKWWKPHIEKSVNSFDGHLSNSKKQLALDEEEAADNMLKSETIFDRAAKSFGKDKITSRIKRRINSWQISSLIRIFNEIGLGQFDKFDLPNTSDDQSDKSLVIQALDLHDQNSNKNLEFGRKVTENGAVKRNHIFGQTLELENALPATLSGLSQSFVSRNLQEHGICTNAELENARNDISNAFQIAKCLYEIMKPIFGNRAFGLRFAVWITDHATLSQKALWIACFALMRRHGANLKSSAEISELARNAIEMKNVAAEFNRVVQLNPKLNAFVTPKVLKHAFSSKTELEKFNDQLKRLVSGTD